MAEVTVKYAKAQKGGTEKKTPVSSKAKPELSQALDSPVEQVLHLQRTIGNRAVTRLIQSGALQAKLKMGEPNDKYERKADRVADQMMRMSMPDAGRYVQRKTSRAFPGQSSEVSSILHLQRTVGNQADDKKASNAEHSIDVTAPIAHDFGTLRILPIHASGQRGASHVDVPAAGAVPEAEIVDQPDGEAPTTVVQANGAADSCEQPRSMHKLTAGAFLGGLTMDSYYPDLAGRGFYSHPGTGGTFDTGSRAGANVQLYGVIPSPCQPGRFHLEQTIERTRFRINGVAHAREGERADDIAKSGRDASRAPFRQEFLGGGDAPLGYIISMADPPSTGYDATSNIEHDRNFVTSLVGPGGRKSVNWSLSTRIENGAVTNNVLT